MFRKQLDTINVIDVEATCWDGKAPEGMVSEIVEIGICTLDVASLKPVNKESIMVRPTRSSVSKFCTSLTTITPEDVEKGISFKEACEVLQTKFHSKKRTWTSWGNYDRLIFEQQCKQFGIGYPFGTNHMNVKNIFALMYELQKETGMQGALSRLDIPLVGTHHRGVDDAYNISMILAKILLSGRSNLQLNPVET